MYWVYEKSIWCAWQNPKKQTYARDVAAEPGGKTLCGVMSIAHGEILRLVEQSAAAIPLQKYMV